MMSCPTLTTNRLTLRPLQPGDNANLRGLLSDPNVRRYLGGPVPDDAISAQLSNMHDDALAYPYWTVLDETNPIGLVSLTPHKDGTDIELSYQFLPAIWGRGLAYEATRAVVDHALTDRTLSRIIAETQIANTASLALLTRLGMAEINRVKRFGAMQAIYATTA